MDSTNSLTVNLIQLIVNILMHFFLSSSPTVCCLVDPLGYMECVCYLLLLGGWGPFKGKLPSDTFKPSALC